MPATAPAGNYTLAVHITATTSAAMAAAATLPGAERLPGVDVARAQLQLEVASIVLPSTASLATAFGQLKVAPEGHGMIG